MKWILTRKQNRADGIWGEMISENGEHFFYTLEHAYKVENEEHPNSVGYYPKIQEGIHPCILYNSPKHGYVVPLLDGPEDKGRFFQIHVLNYNEQSEGCIGVGLAMGVSGGRKMLTSSKQAFEKLMNLGVTELEIVATLNVD